MTRRAAMALLAAAPVLTKAAVKKAGVCRQLITVESSAWTSTRAIMRLWSRENAAAPWHQEDTEIPVVLGQNGLRRGRGLHTISAGAAVKVEGDGCSPAGLFTLGNAFGPFTAKQAALPSWPWKQMTSHHAGVDDVKSAHYNKIVDSRKVQKDWTSAENMIPVSGAYRWGLVVNHNAASAPHGGSCIFLHLWTGPRATTGGCTAMAEQDMVRVLRWLDEGKHPLLAQWPCADWPAACAGVPMPTKRTGR